MACDTCDIRFDGKWLTNVVTRYTAGMYKTFCRYGPRSVLVMLQQYDGRQLMQAKAKATDE